MDPWLNELRLTTLLSPRSPAQQGSLWANDLPDEILSRIISKCANSADKYVTYRCICREWRRSLTVHSPLPPLPSPQIPLLLVPHYDATEPNSPLGSIFPLPSHDPFRYPTTYSLPQLGGTLGCICVGSSHGWLITLGLNSSMSLLNPITGDSLHLPPLSSIDNTVLTFDPNSYLQYYFQQNQTRRSQTTIIRLAVLSSDPVRDPKFTMLLFLSCSSDCCFTCTRDSTTWRQHFHESFWIEDVIFFKGVFVAINLSLTLAIFDFTNLDTGLVMKKQKSILRTSKTEAFLVEEGDNLLLVVMWYTGKWPGMPKNSIRIYKIIMPRDDEAGNIKPYVPPVNSIPNALFLSHGCSVSVSVQLFPCLAKGTVYFPDVYTMQKYDDGRSSISHHAVVYAFTFTQSYKQTSVFEIENRNFCPSWNQLRFLWVTPNLNRK